jgi:hypothetical protein
MEKLTATTCEIADQLEDLLADIQALADTDEEKRILLYSLLRQLPVVAFEPINYTFVGRVVIPLENVMDLLIHLDMYAGGQPVRRGKSPGVVELLSLPDDPELQAAGAAQDAIDVAGISPLHSALLREQAGVRTAEDLLEKGATPQGRSDLAGQTGLSEKLITKWVRRADLMRVEGVGEERGELLESAGVRSVAELSRRNAVNLYRKLKAINAERGLVKQLPSIDQVKNWVVQAKKLV